MISQKQGFPILISLEKIWDRSPHNALTDLIRFNGKWYCTFRESDNHVYGRDGQIRILTSSDAIEWKSAALFVERGVDLRDPKLSITTDGRLMLLTGGTVYSDNDEYITRQPRVAFTHDGQKWTPFATILSPHEWLWRVTWHQGKAYGASYRFSNVKNDKEEWLIALYESEDGIDYKKVVDWDIAGFPNEATLHFNKTGEMIALVRRDLRQNPNAWIGISKPPFEKWEWNVSNHYFGGPNFIILPNGNMWAAGRIITKTPYGSIKKTTLARLTLTDLKPMLILPSAGDTSYPGLVFHQGYLWMSYYSSHESNTAVYFAKVQLPYE